MPTQSPATCGSATSGRLGPRDLAAREADPLQCLPGSKLLGISLVLSPRAASVPKDLQQAENRADREHEHPGRRAEPESSILGGIDCEKDSQNEQEDGDSAVDESSED